MGHKVLQPLEEEPKKRYTNNTNISPYEPMTEAILTERFIKYLPFPKKDYSNEWSHVMQEEFVCGEGIADLVYGWFEKESSRAWSSEYWNILSNTTAATIFYYLKNTRQLTAECISEKTGLTQNTIKRYLRSMTNCGLVRSYDIFFAANMSSDEIPQAEIWSFELKLENWRRALYQSLRYRAFANYAVVVMPADRTKSALSARELFCRYGIGLVSVEKSGERKFLIRPRKQKPHNPALHLNAIAKLKASKN